MNDEGETSTEDANTENETTSRGKDRSTLELYDGGTEMMYAYREEMEENFKVERA